MKKLLFITLLPLLSVRTFATIQRPERLIVGEDTLDMYSLPMYELDSARYKAFEEMIVRRAPYSIMPTGDTTFVISSSLWRNYQGLWRLQNDTLRFVSAVNAEGHPIDFKGLFTENEPASWFSGELRVGSGNAVAPNQLFARVMEYETIYTLERGVNGLLRAMPSQ